MNTKCRGGDERAANLRGVSLKIFPIENSLLLIRLTHSANVRECERSFIPPERATVTTWLSREGYLSVPLFAAAATQYIPSNGILE